MQDARGRSTRSSKRFDPVPEPQPLSDNAAHSSQCDTAQYMCIECSETFHTKLELNSHRQCHVTQKQFTCAHCGRGFHHQVFLEMHERSHEDGMSDAPATRTPGRIISTRSSKAVSSLTADVVHVLPAPPKQPGRLVDSVVDFQREKKVGPAITPQECVTRRTQGAPQPPDQRRDTTEIKNHFELRIAKVLDTTIHLIDPFGNTLEILSEVFNKYTIGDAEQEPGVGDLTVEEPVESLILGSSDDINIIDGPQEDTPEVLLPQEEASKPGEGEKDTEMEEDLPSCHTSSVSADKPLDVCEDSALLPASVSSNSNNDDGDPAHQHSIIQPDSDVPKSSDEEITKPAVNDPSLNDQTEEMVENNLQTETDGITKASDGSLVEDATLNENDAISAETVALIEDSELDLVDERHSTAPLDQEKDQSLIHQEISCTESHSTPSESLPHETPVTDDPERGPQEDSNQQPLLNDAAVKEIGFLLNINSDRDQLDTLCEDDTCNPSTKFDMSLSGWEDLSRRVNHGQILDQLSDTETSDLGDGKAAESVDEETVPVLEDERSSGKQEADNALPELNQGQSSSEDLDYIFNRKTEENDSGEPNFILSNSEKDGGTQDAEAESTPEMDVYPKIPPEGESHMDLVAQEKASFFTAESCASTPDINSLSQMGSSDGEKKTASVAEDEDNFMMEQMDTDLFDGRDILPLDAQVEVGEKIHLTHESSVVFENEMNNNRPAMDHCETEHSPHAGSVSADFSSASENTVIGPREEDPQEKTMTEHDIVTTDVEYSSLGNINALEKGEQMEICNRQDSDFSPTGQDAESKTYSADNERDRSPKVNSENSECGLSSHVPSAALLSSASLLPSEPSEEADDERDGTPPSVFTLVQDTATENIPLHQQDPGQMQVLAPGAEPVAIVGDADDSGTVKENDGFMGVHDDESMDDADQILLTEGSSTIGQMIKTSGEETTISFHSSGPSDATYDIEAETNEKLEGGGGSSSPHKEVCLPATIDNDDGISDDQSTCAREDPENVCLEQEAETEQDQNTVSPESTEILNDEIGHTLNTFTEGDVNIDPLQDHESEGAVEKNDSKSSNHSLEGDRGGAQDKSKDHELDESLSCEHPENTQVSQVSIAGLLLNESPDSGQEKDMEISRISTDSIANKSITEGADEPADESLSAGDIISESLADVPSSQAVSAEGALDVPDDLQRFAIGESIEIKTAAASLEPASQCLKCGRKLRRGRKDFNWPTFCFKCRLATKRQERRANKELSETLETGKEENVSLLSDVKIKQEDVSVELLKPSVSADELQEEPTSKKAYRCHKCDKSFRIPALLAGHMKYHTLPQCLTCGCQMKLKYKTRRIPRRCQKCVQEIKERRKDVLRTEEKSEDEESINSDDETLVTSMSDNQSEVPEGDLSDSELFLSSFKPHKKAYTKLKGQPGRVSRGSELRKRRKVQQGLYCTCETSNTSAVKRCPHCQKLIRDQKSNPAASEKKEQTADHPFDVSDISQDSDLDLKSKQTTDISDEKRRPLKKMKKAQSLALETVLEGNSLTERKVISCKKEEPESSSDEQVISDLNLQDGEKPRLCLQCGKAFKCNRSLNLHLLSHTAILCESCGCRLQKKRRAGRWSKKCRICRLRGKDESVSADDIDDPIAGEKSVTSLPIKTKQTKITKKRKIQSIGKHKKDLKWMNMMMAVKGLKRKRESKSLEQSSTEPGDEAPSVIDAKSGIVTAVTALPQCDVRFPGIDRPGPSGLDYTPKKRGRKCLYKERNIIKVEENQLMPDIHNPAASMTPVSIKQEEENQCLECNQNFPNFDLLLVHQQSHIEGQPPYPCSECPQTFSKEQYLNIHQNSHPEDRPFRCPECNKTFTRRNHLGVHRRVHSGLRPFACPDCPCKFRQKGSLIIHRYTHRNIPVLLLKPYQCSVCSKSFKQRERLIVHERVHTGECPFSCKDCDKVFPSKAKLYMHRKLHKTPDASSAAEADPDSKEDVEIQSYQCQDCDKVCSTKASFVLHRKVHGPSLSSSKQDLSQQQCLEGGPIQCRKCSKVFPTKASLTLHMKLHLKAETQGKAFMCKDCNKLCSTKASLVLHRRVHKTLVMYEQNPDIKAAVGSHPFVCKHCGKVCSTKASFVLHSKVHKLAMSETLLKTSLAPKTFNCKECNTVCTTKATFVLHSKIHKSSDGEQDLKAGPFVCKDCDKVCSTKASLVLHRRVHKSLSSTEQSSNPGEDVTERPLECKDCGKMFSNQEQLSAHSKDHAQEEASPTFDQNLSNKDVEEPQNPDVQEKPFACPTCHMRFKRLKILVRHKLLHGEEGIFPCVRCGKRFLFQKSLLNHGKICQSRSKGKKAAAKRKSMKDAEDSGPAEENVQKKRKTTEKKVSDAQKEKKRKLLQAKKMKEKSKIKAMKEKKRLKEKKPKTAVESDPETAHGKQEKPSHLLPKERKSKDGAKGQKAAKKISPKEKPPKSKNLKKWPLLASSAVQKRTLHAGKKKKARAGGKDKS